MANPLSVFKPFVDNLFLSASLMNYDQAATGMTQWGSKGWNVSSSAHSLNFISSRQLTKAGSQMNGDSMLRIAACFDAVRMISEDIAKLPLDIKREESNGGITTINRKHPLYWRISVSPDKQIRSKTFWESLIAHALVWGNGYAAIDRDKSNGIIRSLQLIHPNNVTIKKTDGIRWYQVTVLDAKGKQTNDTIRIDNMDMFHLHGVGDGLAGWPVANYALESLGLTLSAENYQAAFVGNGGHISGVLQSDMEIKDPEIKKQMAEKWTEKTGGVNNVGNIPILSHGFKYHPISMKFTDAQVMETRAFQVIEIARWFRMPPHKLAILDAATFNNMEEEALSYKNDTLSPWITRLEDEMVFKLFADGSQFFPKFNTRMLTMGDSASRVAYNKEMFAMGGITPNEIRESEGLNPYPEGDEFFLPMNIATVETIVNPPEPPAPEPIEEAEEEEPEEEEVEETEAPEVPEAPEQLTAPINAINYANVIADSFDSIVQREVKYEENPKRDRNEFYQRQSQLYMEKLAVHLSYLDMSVPKDYIQKWTENHTMLNWQENKAQQMANDLILHYYQAQHLPDGLYSIANKQVIKEGYSLRYA